MPTPTRSKLPAKCPVCGSAEINTSRDPTKIATRLFQCASCGTSLKPALSWRMLWVIPVFLCSGAAFFAALLLLGKLHLSGLAFAAARGALWGLFFTTNFGFIRRRFEYRVVTPPRESP